MMEAIEIPESNLWADFVWPEWVPVDVREQVEKRFKPWRANDTGPKQWWDRSEHYQRSRPNFGELLTAEGVRGRYVSMGSVGGVLVLPDGTHKHIHNPGRHGCAEGPPASFTTEKSAAIKHVATSTATVYRLRRPREDGWSGDWCDITIDDEHGTLHVNGDHGSWSYRWGQAITEQIAYWFNPDYIAGKLAAGRCTAYDDDATEREVRLVVLKARRADEVTREQAREAWDALDDIDFGSAETMMSGMGNLYLPDVPNDLFVDVHELIRYTPRGDFLHLRDAYIPALIDLLRGRPSPSPDPLPGTMGAAC